MRKFVCFMLIACIVALSGYGCAPAGESAVSSEQVENKLLQKGIELIGKVDRLAECEAYTGLYTGSEEIASIIKGVAENDYAAPLGVFVIEDVDSLILRNMMPETQLPDDIMHLLEGRFAAALPSQITAMNGATSIAAASILSYGESFICQGLENDVTYLYTYGNDCSFMVHYRSNSENIVSASVDAVINGALSKCASQEEVLSFFADTLHLQGAAVHALSADQRGAVTE